MTIEESTKYAERLDRAGFFKLNPKYRSYFGKRIGYGEYLELSVAVGLFRMTQLATLPPISADTKEDTNAN